MPTVKKSLAMRPALSNSQIQFLRDGVASSEDTFFWSCNEPSVRCAWERVKDELLAEWIQDRSGYRPWAWWEFDAPRWGRKFGAYFDGTLPEPRMRIGGKGTPSYEALNVVPAFTRGIPDSWVSPFDVAYYNGRAKDIHGNAIGTEYKEGNFPHDAIDPSDPPVFESEAAFLDRLGLLFAGERERIPAEAWEPEVVR